MKITATDLLQKFIYDKLEIPTDTLAKIESEQRNLFHALDSKYKDVFKNNPVNTTESLEYRQVYKASMAITKQCFENINEIIGDKVKAHFFVASAIGDISKHCNKNYGIKEVVPMLALQNFVAEDAVQRERFLSTEAVTGVQKEIRGLNEPPTIKQYLNYVLKVAEAESYNIPKALAIVNQQLDKVNKTPSPIMEHLARFNPVIEKYSSQTV